MNKRVEQRNSIFQEIKSIYDVEIATFNVTIDNVVSYQAVYLKISTLLESLKADRLEIRVRLGESFEKWFYDTHPRLIQQLWDESLGVMGFD